MFGLRQICSNVFGAKKFVAPAGLLGTCRLFGGSKVYQGGPGVVKGLGAYLEGCMVPCCVSSRRSLECSPNLFATVREVLLESFQSTEGIFSGVNRATKVDGNALTGCHSMLRQFIG